MDLRWHESHPRRQHQTARAEVEVVLAGGGAVGGGEAVEAAHALFDDSGLFHDADVHGGGGGGETGGGGEVGDGHEVVTGQLIEHGPSGRAAQQQGDGVNAPLREPSEGVGLSHGGKIAPTSGKDQNLFNRA